MTFTKTTLVLMLSLPFVQSTLAHEEAEHLTERLVELSALFASANVLKEPAIVDCTLSDGAKTKCFSITTDARPGTRKMGPWCPRSIHDGADKGGIWLEGGKAYDVSGNFIKELAEFYEDREWQLFDKQTGRIRVTDSKEACLAAAKPDVEPEYFNYCVECEADYLGEDHSTTFVIPLSPVKANKSWFSFVFPERPPFSGYGVAFDGVKLDAPAPTDAILSAYTLAPFDDCGGHVNPHAGYHYHAVTGCAPDVKPVPDHAPMIGLAMDGHGIFAQLDEGGKEPDDLDECRGHLVEEMGYHYHANAAGKNQIIGCLKAQYGCAHDAPDQSCDASRPPKRR